jgi:outer membrane protein, adhesin transport system
VELGVEGLKIKQANLSVVIPLFCFASIAGINPQFAQAENLKELLPALLKAHDLIKASEADLKAAEERVKESRGGWFPLATVTTHYGQERQNKPTDSDDTDLRTRQADLSVTQLVWDFGATNSRIRTAKLSAQAIDYTLEATKQDLILRSVSAFINVDRTARVLVFARESEKNIKRQTELEDSLVKKGAGLSSDVLQAKATLSGAQARRVQSEGALTVARNAYRAVFHTDVADLSALTIPKLPINLIPTSLDEAIHIALRENPKLRTADMGARVATETINTTKASSLYPKFDIVAGTTYKHNVSGTIGHQEEGIAKLQMTFPFNLGLSAINTLRASESDAVSANKRVGETRHLIEQLVRDSWSNLETAKATNKFLKNQASISSEFLALARKERKLGNRSLLDVLNGETALINANSDATSADADVAIASFTWLNAMGRLNLDSIQ